MEREGTTRKLAAILSADVEEYSRLMSQDERGTIRTLTAYKEAMSKLIQEYKGRVVDAPGDNLLAEFGSVVDAVNCAVEIQRDLAERNADLPRARRMEFRIGINLGDIVEEEKRIYGDGVNIAARVEGLANGGGICISGNVHEQVEGKIGLEFEYLGEQEVKNIEKPVSVYRVLSFPGAAAHRVVEAKKSIGKKWRIISLALAVVIVMGVAVGAIWHFYFRPSVEPASVEKMAYALPDKPSIAVLPFNNMSGDPDQEYFADGITEDLITDLSKISDILVIARNSTFVYKGKPVKIKQVSEELGVRYVLEGSVRKASDEVRITAQLIDALTGHHLWADRYDGKLKDVFDLQDEITQKIITALKLKLGVSEQMHMALKDTDNFDAYDSFLKGWRHFLRATGEDYIKAIPYFEKAIELDKNYGKAYAALAYTYRMAAPTMEIQSKGITVLQAHVKARRYLQFAMRKPTSIAYQVASFIDLMVRNWQGAIDIAKKAIELDPNDANGQLIMGRVLLFYGKHQEAIDFFNRALRLDPHHPAIPWAHLGYAYFCMEQYEKASTFLERSAKNNPDLLKDWNSFSPPFLAATYAYLSRENDARAALNSASGFGWGYWPLRRIMASYPFMYSKDADRLAEGLIKAGAREPHQYYKMFIENKLNGEKIRALIFGKKAVGLEGTIYRNKDGESTIRKILPSITEKGKSWVEDEMLCDQWHNQLEGIKICYPIFRNPDGSRAKSDEYLFFRFNKIFPFILVD